MRESGGRQRNRLFACDRARHGSGDMSNYCLSAVSRSSVQLQQECYRYYRGRYLHVSNKERGSIWLPNVPGDCFRAEYFFSLSCFQLQRALSLMSINIAAALSPPLAALPSQCPTPSSFPSVCTDPRGPRRPPRARRGPASINISAGLRRWAERVSQNGSQWHFGESSGNGARNSELVLKWLAVVLHVLAH